ncbi:MAG TPA: hypothetical protein VH062_21885 [Polyangiaceae bacterium]|jgi:hypothetical protein|nr:hypothetical protein [Polyangiaceae bacterium]
MTRPSTRATTALLAALASTACGQAVIRSGAPAGNVAKNHDARWRDGFLLGTVEAADPEPLSSICPGGWSEIRVSASFPAALLDWATLGIYTPTNVTIVCAAPSGVYIGAPSEVPLAPLCR